MANVPEGLYYSKDHEWLKVEGDTGTVGITDYAQNSLGDVVYVELPRKGESFEAHAPFGSVESVKAVPPLLRRGHGGQRVLERRAGEGQHRPLRHGLDGAHTPRQPRRG